MLISPRTVMLGVTDVRAVLPSPIRIGPTSTPPDTAFSVLFRTALAVSALAKDERLGGAFHGGSRGRRRARGLVGGRGRRPRSSRLRRRSRRGSESRIAMGGRGMRRAGSVSSSAELGVGAQRDVGLDAEAAQVAGGRDDDRGELLRCGLAVDMGGVGDEERARCRG